MIKRLRNIQVSKAIALFFMPFLLIVFSNEVRESISDYAYSSVRDLYVFMLTVACTLFINNGLVKYKFYNVLLGLCLLGVIFTPHIDFPIWHYVFAGLFFLGSVFVMIYYSSKKQRWFKSIAGITIVLALIMSIIFNLFSTLVAEWIGLLPICIHFVLEAFNKID